MTEADFEARPLGAFCLEGAMLCDCSNRTEIFGDDEYD